MRSEKFVTLKRVTTKLGNEIKLLGFSDKDSLHFTSHLSLIIGVFHGTEPQGKFLIEKYLEKFPNNSLLFIPCLNPDGMQLGTRTNANGVDLNRNFPTKNWGEDGSKAFFHSLENDVNPSKSIRDYFGGKLAGSEIETQFVMEIIEEYKPKSILTLHSPYKVVNYDGPAKDLAEKISEIIKYPVEASIGYPTPGSFGTYAGIERQIPTITLELDEICPVEDLIEPVHQVFELLI